MFHPKAEALPHFAPFKVVNAIRPIPPNGEINVRIKFEPKTESHARQILRIGTPHIHVILCFYIYFLLVVLFKIKCIVCILKCVDFCNKSLIVHKKYEKKTMICLYFTCCMSFFTLAYTD